MDYVIDSEQLIEGVKSRPVIWDVRDDDYKDRDKKRKAWLELCDLFFEDFESKDKAEQAYMVKQLELKWRHIRDNYTRQVRGKTRYTATSKRRYIYTHQLEFMRETIEAKFNNTSCDSTRKPQVKEDSSVVEYSLDLDEDSDDAYEPVRKRRAAPAKKQKSYDESYGEHLSPIERVDVYKEFPSEDDDTAFFRSLAPMLMTMSSQDKIKFRIEVMQLLLKYNGSCE